MSSKETKSSAGGYPGRDNCAKRPFSEHNAMTPICSSTPKKARTKFDSGEEELMEECGQEEVEREWRRCWEGKDVVMKDV